MKKKKPFFTDDGQVCYIKYFDDGDHCRQEFVDTYGTEQSIELTWKEAVTWDEKIEKYFERRSKK